MVDGKAKCVFCFHSLNATCFIQYIFMVPEIELLTEFKEKKFVFAGTDSKNKAEFLIFHANAH